MNVFNSHLGAQFSILWKGSIKRNLKLAFVMAGLSDVLAKAAGKGTGASNVRFHKIVVNDK